MGIKLPEREEKHQIENKPNGLTWGRWLTTTPTGKKLVHNIYNKLRGEKLRTCVYLDAGFLFCGDRIIFSRNSERITHKLCRTRRLDRMFGELTLTFYRKLTCIMLVCTSRAGYYRSRAANSRFLSAFLPHNGEYVAWKIT